VRMRPHEREPALDTPRVFCVRREMVAVTLGLANLQLGCKSSAERATPAATAVPSPAAAAALLPKLPDYRSWEDLYRNQWVWESVVRGTHTMTNCVSGCAWDCS